VAVQLQVKGRNMDVTDALFLHAERKLGRLARAFPSHDEATQVELELSVERNPKIDRPQIAELTVRTRGPVLRVRESAPDMYQAIDQAAHKIERQAQRLRERRRQRRPAAGASASERPPPPADAASGPRLVKNKRFALPEMSPDDATLAMDLLHHDFYVFRNADDGGEVNVVYRRRDGNYGLIAPEG
jgi:putative sigma-54 modulation protein